MFKSRKEKDIQLDQSYSTAIYWGIDKRFKSLLFDSSIFVGSNPTTPTNFKTINQVVSTRLSNSEKQRLLIINLILL